MKATQLLIQQHEEVSALFEQFENAENEDEQAEIFEEIAARLAAHDAIEREIFYPACKSALGEDEDILAESLAEHGLVEFCLYKADIAGEDDLPAHVTVLKEIVEHHVEEEQDDLFPKVEEAMTSDQLDELGSRMEKRFELALQGDFREAVRKNLEQVLQGALETTPGTKQTPVAKKSKAANGTSRSVTRE